MRRDIADLLRDHLDYFQGFEHVKVYYDNAQAIVKSALNKAVYEVLSKQAVVRKRTTMTEYRLSQEADYLLSFWTLSGTPNRTPKTEVSPKTGCFSFRR